MSRFETSTWAMAILLAVAGPIPKASAQGATGDPGPHGTVAFRVVDARDGSPLAGVLVRAAEGPGGREPRTTDEDGRCVVEIPKAEDPSFPRLVTIQVAKEGFVPVLVGGDGRLFGETPPETYTVALRPGVPIGGVVRDERGAPIAGARVFVAFWRPLAAGSMEAVGFPDDFSVVTDARGAWTTATMPEDLAEPERPRLRVVHPDYATLRSPSRTPDRPGDGPAPSIADLRARKGDLTMEGGVEFAGRVVDDEGRPIASTRVLVEEIPCVECLAQSPFQSVPILSPHLATETDADGRFRFAHVQPGRRHAFFDAAGFLRTDEMVEAAAGLPPREFPITSVADAVAAHNRRNEAEKAADPDALPREWLILAAAAAAFLALAVLGRLRSNLTARRPDAP